MQLVASGVFNYVNTFAGLTINAAGRKGSGTKNTDGASSGTGGSAMDAAITGSGDMLGLDGLSWGVGYGTADAGEQQNLAGAEDADTHATIFANYSFGPTTFSMQKSSIDYGANGTASETTDAWGLAVNVNDDISISYGERDVEFGTNAGAHVTENGEGIAIAYTMGSMKIAETETKFLTMVELLVRMMK